MEITRFYKKLGTISSNFEKAYENDINIIIDNLFDEYDILYKDTDTNVQKSIIINKFLSILGKSHDEIICNGFSQNGNKCFRKANRNSQYCKTHNYLTFKQQQQSTISSSGSVNKDMVILLQSKNEEEKPKLNTNKLKKQLIEDTFYYIDDLYIYSIDSLERVGYIDDSKFYLTDDPFILDL